jgi:hypothetical protein
MAKDALGHGSDARGTHAAGVNAVGLQWTKNKQKNLETAKRTIEGLGHKAVIGKSVGNGVAYYHDGGVFLNENAKFWRDPVGSAQRWDNLSSNVPEHVIHHEIGHALYAPPDNFFHLSHQDLARTHVSKYAARNPKEFVSEVHAGMKAGKSYPEEVMSIFRNYARPRK